MRHSGAGSFAMAMRSHYCGLVTEALLGQTVTLSGWVNRRRDHGGVIFIDLRDREGSVQVVCDPDRAEMFKTAEGVRNEFCVQVKGMVRARPEGTTNDNLQSGKIEVLCHELNVLNPSVTPPFQIDEENLSETTRLTHRVLDLRRPYMQNNLKLRYRVSMEVRKFLDANGFIDIETPMLTKSTPEGARDYLVPSRVHDGHFFALPQSPQLFKQLLMVSGFDRYYQITKCFRDEDLRADRQPEFTQIDIETSFMDEQEIRDMFQGMIKTVFQNTLGVDLGEFPVMTYQDAAHRFGSDKPDLRVKLEFTELTDVMADVDFKVAAGTAFREAFMQADPTFLEPIMELEVVTPDQYLGSVLGDITSRDGKILHLEAVKGHQIIKAELPLVKTFGYATTLRSLSQGRAANSMQFSHFSAVDQSTRERLYPLFAGRPQ